MNELIIEWRSHSCKGQGALSNVRAVLTAAPHFAFAVCQEIVLITDAYLMVKSSQQPKEVITLSLHPPLCPPVSSIMTCSKENGILYLKKS